MMRATEQTAVLLACREGREGYPDVVAGLATLSMAGYLSQSFFNLRLAVSDELYDAPAGDSDHPTAWQRLQELRPLQSSLAREAMFNLDFCASPIDGKHAFSRGESNGTISSLCCAVHDAASPVFLPPRSPRAGARRPGPVAHLNRSPPWLAFALAQPTVASRRGVRHLRDDLAKAVQEAGGSPERVISSMVAALDVDGVVAYLDEPSKDGLPIAAHLPAVRRRRLVGSSVAACISAMRPETGIGLVVAVMRHAQAVQASVAAWALGGAIIAAPLHRMTVKPTQGETRGRLVLESETVTTHEDFVKGTPEASGIGGRADALLVLSGISEHLTTQPVRIRENVARVHTLCLSARTGSFRSLDHTLLLDGPQATRFAAFDPGATIDGSFQRVKRATEAEWHTAGHWRRAFDRASMG